MDRQLFCLRCNAPAIEDRIDSGLLKIRCSQCSAIMVNKVPNAVCEGFGTKTVSARPTMESEENQPKTSISLKATKSGLRNAQTGMEGPAPGIYPHNPRMCAYPGCSNSLDDLLRGKGQSNRKYCLACVHLARLDRARERREKFRQERGTSGLFTTCLWCKETFELRVSRGRWKERKVCYKPWCEGNRAAVYYERWNDKRKEEMTIGEAPLAGPIDYALLARAFVEELIRRNMIIVFPRGKGHG